MQSKFLPFAVLTLCATLSGCSAPQTAISKFIGRKSDDSPVIVEINNAPERKAAFEQFVKARLSDFAGEAMPSQAEGDQLRSRLLDEFVQRQFIVREALKKGIIPTEAEMQHAIEQQHKQAGAGGSDQSTVTLQGNERREEIVNELLTLKYYQNEVLKEVQVTPAEIEEYFNRNKQKYAQQNGFYVREIRVPSEAEAQQLHRQAQAKTDDFATLAKQNSKAPTSINGGLIYYESQQLPPVLAQAIAPLKVGHISPVVRSNYGFHIFKLEQRAEPLPLDKVRDEIKDKLLRDKNQALINAYNERALAGAQIKIHRDQLGFNYVGNLKPGA